MIQKLLAACVIAAGWNVVKTCNLNRNRWACFLYLFALIVGHSSYTSYGCACNYSISNSKCTILNKNCCDCTSALVKTCFDYCTLCGTVRICFKLLFHFHYQRIKF